MSICKNNHHIRDGKSIEHIDSWHCHECNKEKFQFISIFFLLFIFPVILYVSIIKSGEVESAYGMWIVIILWWALFGTYLHYRKKVSDLMVELSEKDYIITDIEKMLGITAQLENKIKGKIKIQKEKIIKETEKNNSWDDLADYQENFGADIGKEELLLNQLRKLLENTKKI